MKQKYFLLWVDNASYTKDGQVKPWYNYYLCDGEKVVVRSSRELFGDMVDGEVLSGHRRVEAEVNLVEKKDGTAFLSLKNIVTL